MYLGMPAIESTVAALSSLCCRGSVLAMTYAVDAGSILSSFLHLRPRALLFHIWLRYWAHEPFAVQSHWTPETLPGWLAERGWRLKSDRTSVDIAKANGVGAVAAELAPQQPPPRVQSVALGEKVGGRRRAQSGVANSDRRECGARVRHEDAVVEPK